MAKKTLRNVIEYIPKKIGLSMYSNISSPLILEMQSFWFEKLVSEYLDNVGYFEASNGLLVTIYDGFTYEPIKMEGKNVPYLFGFYSNESGNAYEKLSILCDSDMYKERLRNIILSGLTEMLMQAFARKGLKTNDGSSSGLRISIGISSTD